MKGPKMSNWKRSEGKLKTPAGNVIDNKSKILNKIPSGLNGGGKSVDGILGKRKAGKG